MAERVIRTESIDGKTIHIVSGTEFMTPGEGGTHTRLLWASVPPFASRPDITVSIYSDDDMPPVLNNPEERNAGLMFRPWQIQYVPRGGTDGKDLIAIASAITNVGQQTDVRVMCSYLAIGEPL